MIVHESHTTIIRKILKIAVHTFNQTHLIFCFPSLCVFPISNPICINYASQGNSSNSDSSSLARPLCIKKTYCIHVSRASAVAHGNGLWATEAFNARERFSGTCQLKTTWLIKIIFYAIDYVRETAQQDSIHGDCPNSLASHIW